MLARFESADVGMETWKAVCAFDAAVIDEGLTAQVPGSDVPEQESATVPEKPPMEVRSRLKVAVAPADTVRLVPPLVAGPSSKSSAVPVKATFTELDGAFD